LYKDLQHWDISLIGGDKMRHTENYYHVWAKYH